MLKLFLRKTPRWGRVYDSPIMTTRPVHYMDRTRLYYEAQGFDKSYLWAHFEEVPFAPLVKPLSESTLALITTASLHDRAATEPRAVASGSIVEPPRRLFANDLAWDKEATHLDDLNSYFPIDHLAKLVADGRIGRLAERFHCAPTDYSQHRTSTSDAPEILKRCRADGADVALLVPM